MTHYAIGDLQGCYTALQALLKQIHFNPDIDKLWFAGDLVNRGPNSLDCLRFIKDLSDSAQTVLGNHDLHLLAVINGIRKPRQHDTFNEILAAKDLPQITNWLRTRPFMLTDIPTGFHLTHAGLPPQWTLAEATQYARELEAYMQSSKYQQLLTDMYGNNPVIWSKNLTGSLRYHYLINAFTRLRYCTQAGALDLRETSAPGQQADGLIPWYEYPTRRSQGERILFGHWSTVTLGQHKDFARHSVYPLDTGCLWGGALTAFRLHDGQYFKVPCQPSKNYLRTSKTKL